MDTHLFLISSRQRGAQGRDAAAHQVVFGAGTLLALTNTTRTSCYGNATELSSTRRCDSGQGGMSPPDSLVFSGLGVIRWDRTEQGSANFECGAFNHSATSPWRRARQCQ